MHAVLYIVPEHMDERGDGSVASPLEKYFGGRCSGFHQEVEWAV